MRHHDLFAIANGRVPRLQICEGDLLWRGTLVEHDAITPSASSGSERAMLHDRYIGIAYRPRFVLRLRLNPGLRVITVLATVT